MILIHKTCLLETNQLSTIVILNNFPMKLLSQNVGITNNFLSVHLYIRKKNGQYLSDKDIEYLFLNFHIGYPKCNNYFLLLLCTFSRKYCCFTKKKY